MSSSILLTDFAIAARPVAFKSYGLEYDKLPKFYEEVASIEKMNGYVDEDIRLAGMGRLRRKLEGEAFALDRMRQEYITRYVSVDYALGASVSRRAIEQAKGMDIMGMIAKELANANVQERSHRIAALFNMAFDSAALPMADGAALCAPNAPNQSGLAGSNKLSVDADFSEASLETMLIQMQTDARNTVGEFITLMPDKLVIHPSTQFDVMRVLNSGLRAGTADNDANLHKGLFGSSSIVTSQLLSDPDAWFILTSENKKGFGFKVKENRAFEIDTDVDFKTSSVLVKGETSFAVGVTDRLCVYGSQGA